jgi:predicted molibdopterin-dependent oxidoreductase YjgC
MTDVPRDLRLPRPGAPTVALSMDGMPVFAHRGETVATVLLALGMRSFRRTDRQHAPRGVFCGMGVCFDCLVTIDGQPNVRACVTTVQEGMRVETGEFTLD